MREVTAALFDECPGSNEDWEVYCFLDRELRVRGRDFRQTFSLQSTLEIIEESLNG